MKAASSLIKPKSNLNVVVTGGSKGFGKALVKQFVKRGDNVIFTSRSRQNINESLNEFRSMLSNNDDNNKIIGLHCNASCVECNNILLDEVSHNFDSIDLWINNAALSGGFGEFANQSLYTIHDIVATNLAGTIMSTKLALEFQKQHATNATRAMHIFNVIGAGSDGFPTANYAVYGATKSGIKHFTDSLRIELKNGINSNNDNQVALHFLSPGMMVTDLLVEGTTEKEKRFFNMLCELPDTVAESLLPEIIHVVHSNQRNKTIEYLHLQRIISKLFWGFIKPSNRFFETR